MSRADVMYFIKLQNAYHFTYFENSPVIWETLNNQKHAQYTDGQTF